VPNEPTQRTSWLARWRERRRDRVAWLGLAAATLVAGCGSSDHTASTTTERSTSTTATGGAVPSGIRSRVLTSNELAGFKPAGVSVYRTPSSLIAGEQASGDQASTEKAMLSRDGFRVGVHEDLMSAAAGGASIVERFRSPAAARDALAFYVSSFKTPGAQAGGAAYAPFKVSGIPGAVGFSIGPVNGGGINIVFTDGAYYYLVGQDGGSATAVASLNAAARHLYRRVHG
jgi:hypothetical protein